MRERYITEGGIIFYRFSGSGPRYELELDESEVFTLDSF